MAKGSTPFPVSASKAEDDYRAEDDHRTLSRAEEVRSDPKRFAKAARHARKTVRAVSRIYRRTAAAGRIQSR